MSNQAVKHSSFGHMPFLMDSCEQL